MSIFEFITLFIAILSTIYYINYRILIVIKLFVYKEYLEELPMETDEEVQNYQHSAIKINGLYKQLDNMETICYWDMLIMAVSWTITLFLILY